MTRIHCSAEQGFSLEADAYHRGRPGYSAEVVDSIRKYCRVGPGSDILDLAAGTGKFTLALRELQAELRAVEPLAEMRRVFRGSLPGIPIVDGTAEAIPFADKSFDLVTCAQAFHWFANPSAVAEIGRVLRPGGWLALVWNVRDEGVPWLAEISALMSAYEAGTPRRRSDEWQGLFPCSSFGPGTTRAFKTTHLGSIQESVFDRFLSVSFIAALPPDAKAAFKAQLQGVVDEYLGGAETIETPYTCEVYIFQRLPG